METHTKLTRQQSEEIFRQYFLTECYQGPQKLWHHKCGTLIRMHQASLSIHREPLDQCPGLGVVRAPDTAETHAIPYCSRCETVPKDTGCLHDLGPPAVAFDIIAPQIEIGPPILVWRFAEAPEEYQKRSPHGGDEDWLALVPPHIVIQGIPDWLESPGFGVMKTSLHALHPGFVIVIGVHS